MALTNAQKQAAYAKRRKAKLERLARLEAALERIANWEMPATGMFWKNQDGSPSDRPISYGAAYGSNGEKDVIRDIARQALAGDERGEG